MLAIYQIIPMSFWNNWRTYHDRSFAFQRLTCALETPYSLCKHWSYPEFLFSYIFLEIDSVSWNEVKITKISEFTKILIISLVNQKHLVNLLTFVFFTLFEDTESIPCCCNENISEIKFSHILKYRNSTPTWHIFCLSQ